MQRKGFLYQELTIGLGAFALVLFMCPCSWLFRGCESPPKGIEKSEVYKSLMKEEYIKSPIPKSNLDFTGLKGVINGKWVNKTNEHHRLEFTAKSIEELQQYRSSPIVGKYEIKSELLHITDEDGRIIIYGLEFLSDEEISIRPEKKLSYNDFYHLTGHWQRVSLPIGEKLSLEKGPIADAKRQVQKIEIKLSKIEGILESALTDRDELAGNLRSYGVNSAADLKDNIRGQRVADNLAKIAGEIDGLERQLASIESELLKAKTIVRRMEQEAAGISETEMRMLAQQLREVEDRTDGIRATPANAIDIDKAVEKALKAQGRPKKSK